jgi:hypothetical protein
MWEMKRLGVDPTQFIHALVKSICSLFLKLNMARDPSRFDRQLCFAY